MKPGAPNWWGWGWGPGHQETAEFSILEAFFVATYGFRKRIREIEHPALRGWGGWLITFADNTSAEVPF